MMQGMHDIFLVEYTAAPYHFAEDQHTYTAQWHQNRGGHLDKRHQHLHTDDSTKIQSDQHWATRRTYARIRYITEVIYERRDGASRRTRWPATMWAANVLSRVCFFVLSYFFVYPCKIL
jgi:hypothetical protein